MSNIDPTSVAIYAAGIADSLASIRFDLSTRSSRIDTFAEEADDHCGMMRVISEAAKSMERFRVVHGINAKWGCELPFLYDAWDAIALALWAGLGKESVEDLVERSLLELASQNA